MGYALFSELQTGNLIFFLGLTFLIEYLKNNECRREKDNVAFKFE
jgi:putative Mn2+ efflux pump MntP